MMQLERSSDVRRDYSPADVERLASSFSVHHTLAEMGAARLRHPSYTEQFLPTIGALAGSTETAQSHEEQPADRPQYEGLVHDHHWTVHDWAAR